MYVIIYRFVRSYRTLEGVQNNLLSENLHTHACMNCTIDIMREAHYSLKQYVIAGLGTRLVSVTLRNVEVTSRWNVAVSRLRA